MQPKFTLKIPGLFARVIAMALMCVCMAQVSYSQDRPQAKEDAQRQLNALRSDNDAGRPSATPSPVVVTTTQVNTSQINIAKSLQRPEAVCSTINGTLQAGDQTLTGNRPFRDGVLPTTCANKTCTAGVAGAGSFYDVINFTNTESTAQCVTLTYTVTAITGGTFTFLSVHEGSFNPANTCQNYLSDIGSSPATGTPVTLRFTLAGNATAAIVVSSVGVITSANYTLVIDGICAPCVPNNATAPTISSVPSSTCSGSPITLSVIGGSLNGAAEWRWYSGSCGGTPVGTGNSITVSPAATTTYYVRGEGGCAPAAGPCGQQTVTVSSCTCLTPDVATICTGDIQRLAVTPTGATTTSFNGGAISIPAGAPGTTSGIGGPYPSAIAVAGLPASGAGVYVNSVSINGFSHSWPSDVDIVLVSPTGQRVVIMSDAGGSTDVTGINMVFSDAAAAILPPVLASGTWKPTNIAGPDNWPAPGPGSITNVNPTLSSFTGNPNGNWNLYVFDQFGGDFGAITSWSISFRVVPTAVWSPIATLFRDAAGTIPYVAGTEVDFVYARPTATTTYTATISSGPCAGANNVTVTVLPRPTVSISPATGGCSPVTLTASGAVSYSWTPGAGLNTTQGATVTATSPVDQTYTVLGYGANGCSNTATVPVRAISTAAVMTAPPAFNTLFAQNFDVASPLPSGWAQQNLSNPVGITGWFQGNSGVFPSFNGPATSYIAANWQNTTTTGSGDISNWLFTPTATVQNGDQLTFYTRSTGSTFPDRLEVRMSTNGASTNVGSTSASVGDYTTVLLTINPNLVVPPNTAAYPAVWTKYTATVTGLPAPTSARFAFRYWVTNGGGGANSDYMGIDNVELNRPLAGVCANTVSNISVNITGGVGPFTLVYSNGTTNTTYNGYTSGAPIQVSPATTTTYTIVSITGANGCPGINNSGSAVISVTPPPSVTTQPTNQAACNGGNATFTVVTAPATGNTFQWQVSTDNGATWNNVTNGGVYSGATTATLGLTGVTSSMAGYRYRVAVTGQCPPSPINSNSATLAVNTPPTVTTQPANITRCVGTTATFTAAASGNSPTYQWQVSTDGGTTWTNITGATSATLSVSNVTSAMNNNRYRAVVTVAPCATTATTNAATLTVNALPTVTLAAPVVLITPGQTATLTATSTPGPLNANSFSWTLNGSPLDPPVTTNPLTVNIDGLGTYQATVTDINGCVGTSNELVIGGAQSDRLWIYPSPTNGSFQVRLYSTGSPTEQRVVSLYTTTGQLIDRKKFTLTNANGPYLRMEFDLTNQAAGAYVVKVEDRYSKVITSGFVVKQ